MAGSKSKIGSYDGPTIFLICGHILSKMGVYFTPRSCSAIFLLLFMFVCSDCTSRVEGASTNNSALLTQLTVVQPTPTRKLFPTSTVTAITNLPALTTKPPSTRMPAPSLADASSFQMCSPIEGFPIKDLPKIISVGYHPPPKGQDDRHEGIDLCFYQWKDLGSIEGKGIQSVLSGWIAAALDGTFPYGSFVIVETPGNLIPQELRVALKMSSDESLYALYAHMQDQSLKVRLDQEVSVCQILGAVGRTGNTSAPHLHFETRIGPPGARFEGMSNFTESATEEERKNYRIWRIGGLYNHFDPMQLLSFGIELAQP